MVIVRQAFSRLVSAVILAADDAEPILPKLDPQQRGAVILVLIGLVILLLGMIALVWMGAQHVRRVARQRPAPRPLESSSWSRPPLGKKKSELDSDAEDDEEQR